MKSEVTSLRLYLSGQEIKKLNRELTIAVSERAKLTETMEIDQKQVQELSERLTELAERAGAVGSDLDRDTLAAAKLETTAERLRRLASVSVERSRAVTGRREAVVERRADLEEELASISDELASIDTDRRQAESSASLAEAEFRRLEDEERAIATQNSLSPEGAQAVVRGELSALESSMNRDQRELDRLSHRIDVLSAQRNEAKLAIERINTDIRTMDTSITELQRSYDSTSKTRMTAQEKWSAAEETVSGARIEKAAALARRDAVIAALEGRFDADARNAVESAPGALGSLVSQLDIPEGLQAPVNAALGVWADAVAFGDAVSVKDAVEAVKGEGGGSVSVVSSSSRTATPAREAASSLGLVALVDRLGPDHHPGLASRLLGDVVLVEGWSAGWALVSKYPALRAVTPEGDVVSVSGVRIADPDGAGSAMLEAAEVALERADTELARAESIHIAAKRDFEKSREAERKALESLELAESSIAGHTEAMKRLQTTLRSITEEQERLQDRRSAVCDSIAAGNAQVDVLRQRLEALEGEEAERLAMWEEMEEHRTQLAARRETARSDWQEAATAMRGVVERQNLLTQRKRRIEDELGRLDLGVIGGVDPAPLQHVGRLARQAVSVLEGRIEELRVRQARLRDTSHEVRSDLENVRAEHQEKSQAIADALSRVGELDVRLTELRMKKESVMEAVRRDADADVEDAVKAHPPDVPADADLEEMLETGLAQLRRFGPINPLAAQEYRDLEERHTFLSEQMADVTESSSELRKVISVLETEIQNRFDEAFDEVADSYERYFGVLFPGGRGRIRLIDPEDPHSGVSIDAQPLGKKVSQMTLLSGGERSLAALAFVFAVFDARPSPFYVLDEVEAALDDANLRRFLRVVDEFRQRAQLIIITHQQQTMEAADVLYGVTMEPGGSSKAIRKEMRSAIAADNVA
ncbi:MAG TPA: AAA family ATPase [Acidimicrobiia bacterium]|nr:AAA family ATPase [Acidimicrobiia bacterium]